MKKHIYMVLIGMLLCACTKNTELNDPYSSGVCIGKIELGAAAGSLSIAVETKENWRVETDRAWLKTDTEGRSGNGAFTVRYESNESDVVNLNAGRICKVTIRLEESMKTDTLVFVQQGFYPVDTDIKVEDDPSFVIEYKEEKRQDVTLLCCCSEGTGDIQAWIQAQNADIVVLDGEVIGKVEGLNVRGCNYAGFSENQKFETFRKLIQDTYNSGPNAGDNWIFAGQMYHYSVMQAGYESTPKWYPSSKEAGEFRSDIYAWQNNLYDCVWMYKRNYVETYADEDGKSYSADYVYASSAVFAKVTGVELLDIEGMSHKAIKLTLKY